MITEQPVNNHADMHKVTDDMLREVGLSIKDSGGKVTFAGAEPVRKTTMKAGAAPAIIVAGFVAMMLLAEGAFASAHDSDITKDPRATPQPAGHNATPDLAKEATDPSAILTQLGFFAWDGQSTTDFAQADTMLFQPVLPMSKSNVLRPALPLLRTVDAAGNKTTGFGDLLVLDVFLFQLPHATWGVGPVVSLPTATDNQNGSEKYELGPMAMFMWKGMEKNLVGVLGYNTTSVAGESTRADVNKFFFQPIWIRHFKWGYLGWTDQTSSIDWENSSQYSIATGLRFGKVWAGKTPLNMAIQPYYFINEGRDDVVGLKLSVTFIKPGWLKH
jgi:hypothetical protein